MGRERVNYCNTKGQTVIASRSVSWKNGAKHAVNPIPIVLATSPTWLHLLITSQMGLCH